MIDFSNWTAVTEWVLYRGPFVLKVESTAVNYHRWEFLASVWANNEKLRDGGMWKTPEEAKAAAEAAANELASELAP